MFYFDVFVHRGLGEEDPEEDSHTECEAGKDEPCFSPSRPYSHWFGLADNQTIHDALCGEHTNRSAQAVCHHHKEPLCGGALCFFGLLIDIKGTGDIEEIKGEAVNDTTQDEEDDAWESGVTCSKETKTEYPSEHRHEHHVLDTESLKEERNSQDTECFAYLRDGDEDVRVLYTKGIGKLRPSASTRSTDPSVSLISHAGKVNA